MRKSTIQRFLDKVDKRPGYGPAGDCWRWCAGTDSSGYGNFYYLGRRLGAHRVSYMLHVHQDIPKGMSILHSCHTPLCVNPNHLRVGTQLENIADRDRAGRQARGAGVSLAKLTDDQIIEIRSLYDTGEYHQYEIADMYGIERSGVSRIVSGAIWKHVKLGKRTKSSPKGAENGRAKLTEQDVYDIRSKSKNSNVSKRVCQEWARRYQVSESTVRSVIQRRTWRHLP